MIGSTVNNLAGIHHYRGEYDQAIELLNQSLEISKQIGDELGIPYTLNNIAESQENKGEYEEALSHALEAYGISERLKSPQLDRSRVILSHIKQRLGSEAYERLVEKVERDMPGSS